MKEGFIGETAKVVMEAGQGRGKSRKSVILGKVWKRRALT